MTTGNEVEICSDSAALTPLIMSIGCTPVMRNICQSFTAECYINHASFLSIGFVVCEKLRLTISAQRMMASCTSVAGRSCETSFCSISVVVGSDEIIDAAMSNRIQSMTT